MFVSSSGSPYRRFRAALRSGNLTMVRAAAAELPGVGLLDALEICLLMSRSDDERYDRAATRWLARFACEVPSVRLDDLRLALHALEALPYNPVAARATLAEVCAGHGMADATNVLVAAPRQ